MDGTGKVLGMLRNAPLPPTLLNLQQGLIFDIFPLPWAHHSPVAILTAWAANTVGALQPVGEQSIHCRGQRSGFGVARARGWQPLRPLPCLWERDEVGSSTGRPGGTG